MWKAIEFYSWINHLYFWTRRETLVLKELINCIIAKNKYLKMMKQVLYITNWNKTVAKFVIWGFWRKNVLTRNKIIEIPQSQKHINPRFSFLQQIGMRCNLWASLRKGRAKKEENGEKFVHKARRVEHPWVKMAPH